MTDYGFTDGMREISGFGGSYEEACRAMVVAGVEWLDAHPAASPKIGEFEGVLGLTTAENEDADAFREAMADAAREVGDDDGGPTGAMMQFASRHAMSAHEMGWAAYVEEMETDMEEAQ